jgi:DNA-binding response OmpR family regulator
VTRRILLVDDEPKVLQAIQRQFGERYELRTASDPVQGLAGLAAEGPFALVISDYRMPGMNGVQFLAEVKRANADTVRMLLTGHADLATAIAAVNESGIFRLLTKPCAPEILRASMDAALEQYRLITCEHELLEKTLSGSVKVLTEVLSLLNPPVFSHACLIRKYAKDMAAQLRLSNGWELELAAMLCHLGYITLPQQLLDKVAAREKLTKDEQAVYSGHSAVAARLLENIPRLEAVARMIRNQDIPLKPCPDQVLAQGDNAAIGEVVLKTALEFDRLINEGSSRSDALGEMRRRGVAPSELLDVLATAELHLFHHKAQMLPVRDLDATMIANQDISTLSGVLLVPKGRDLTSPIIERLRAFAKSVGIPEPLSVLVPDSSSLGH